MDEPGQAAFAIRRAGPRDLDALNAVTQASSAYDGPYRAILDGYGITHDQLQRDLFRLAERSEDGGQGGDAIQGYYSLTRIDNGMTGELDLMFVADRAQGSGLGRMLFADMVRTARLAGLRAVRIVSHPPSVGFYERMGARRVGEMGRRGRVTWNRPILELTLDATTGGE